MQVEGSTGFREVTCILKVRNTNCAPNRQVYECLCIVFQQGDISSIPKTKPWSLREVPIHYLTSQTEFCRTSLMTNSKRNGDVGQMYRKPQLAAKDNKGWSWAITWPKIRRYNALETNTVPKSSITRQIMAYFTPNDEIGRADGQSVVSGWFSWCIHD